MNFSLFSGLHPSSLLTQTVNSIIDCYHTAAILVRFPVYPMTVMMINAIRKKNQTIFPSSICLVCIDLNEKNPDGYTMIKAFREPHPNLAVLFSSNSQDKSLSFLSVKIIRI